MEQETHRRIEGSHPQETRPRIQLSQETKAILAAATSIIVLPLGLLITSLLTSARIEARIDQMQAEARSDRAAWQAEARAVRAEAKADQAAWQAEARAVRAEVKADQAAWQAEIRTLRAEAKADRQDFQRQILRLTEAQVRTAAVVEQMQTASR